MIKSFNCKETEKLFNREHIPKLSYSLHRVALRKLLMLDEAASLKDLRVPPGNRLEQLSGNRKGQYSIRINAQYRICFEWKDGDKFNVEIVDYH
ncbi:MAG TPA: type II toxin-antitoxin system RelE/ParE family toxin [Gammaproteobacteria bacterium]|nr:type II toxin-antitoxin system RelE/ParE family toxin [Gammaproteobacteria bacterium]